MSAQTIINNLTKRTRKNVFVSFLLVISLFSLPIFSARVFCQQPDAAAAAVPVKNDNYRIGAGDVIDVIVGKNEVLSRAGVRVGNSGMIQLSMLDGDVPAACRTERELADEIREKYKKYLLNPYVTVAVKEFNSSPVALIGAVNTPVRVQLQRPMRLLEVITLGNGPGANAGRSVQIIRNSNYYCEEKILKTSAKPSDELISFALAETLKGSELANPFVQSGDIVRVVEVEQTQAYIVGNVRTAMTINLKEPVTLTQAVAMAGGTTPDAQIEKVKISRQVPNSLDKTEVFVNLKEISRRKSEDVLLRPNDIVEIPGPTGSKKLLKDIFKTIVPSITRLPIGF